MEKKMDESIFERHRKAAIKYKFIPLFEEYEFIEIEIDTPMLPKEQEDLEVYFGKRVLFNVISRERFHEVFNKLTNSEKREVDEIISDLGFEYLKEYTEFDYKGNIENIEDLAYEAPIINLVNTILSEAIKQKASDIHIETFNEKISIRYRIDGVLFDETDLPLSLLPAITTRIKIMANLNIAERRLPQDGRIKIRILGKEIDMRIATAPTISGENIIIRLLDKNEGMVSLEALGMSNYDNKKYIELLKNSSGIILVTGPTGSGKTTTLYATLNYLNSREKKIITIEDPIEYQVDGINQIQVKPEIGFTFANGLRSILRQDPDIIMVGEIRDVETAKIAVQAALTGHLVFATLHTNDAVGAIMRLMDLGVEDYLIAASLKGIIAQRLVRKKCLKCSGSIEKTICPNCAGSGYKGRIGVFEIFEVNSSIKEQIKDLTDINEVKKLAENSGMKSMYQDGLEKAVNGITTREEVLRVISS